MSKDNVSASTEHLHDPEFVKNIREQVLKDIEYIKKFKSVAPNAKPASGWKNAKIVKMTSQSIYPQLYGFLMKNYSKEECIQKLREMGRRTVPVFYSIHPQRLSRRGSLLEILKEIGVHSRERFTVAEQTKKDGVIQKCVIKKYKCVFCTEGYPVEDTGVAYCYASVAFWQNYYNIRSLNIGNMKPTLIYADVTKTAKSDDDYCLYTVETLE